MRNHMRNLLCFFFVICVRSLILSLIVFCVLGCFGLLSGCAPVADGSYQKADQDTSVEYSTEYAQDVYNYTLNVNRELDLILNKLSTHTAIGNQIIRGKYIAEDEASTVEHDLDMVAEAIESVEFLNPPVGYEDDRDTILTQMVNAQSSLQAYLNILQSGDTSGLQDAVDMMEGDFVTITSAFNLPWE